MKSALPISLWLTLVLCSSAFAQLAPAAPAEMISNYRLQHGEGRVTSDATLNRIAHEQAATMASKDVLDHGVLGPFASRLASSKSERAAENISYGHDSSQQLLVRSGIIVRRRHSRRAKAQSIGDFVNSPLISDQIAERRNYGP